jgi:MFS family permease
MLSPYRTVLQTPGAAAFTVAGFVARLPIAMIALGIVLYISAQSGSYALAGALTATFTVVAAACAILTSRLIDRLGQRAVLPGLIAIHGVALVGFVVLVELNASTVLLFAVIAIAGAAQPAIGAAVRARWVYVLKDPSDIRSAFALESILDEVVFTVGPLLATFLALSIALPLPLLVGAALAVIGSLTLAGLRSTAPPRNQYQRARGEHAIKLPGIPAMILVAVGAGILFGSFEVSTVAFMRFQGQEWATGLVLALFAFGSMVGGLWFGSRHFTAPLPIQLAWTTLALFIAVAPLPFLPGVFSLAIAALLAGTLVAPVLISMFATTQRLVPSALLTEGLTWTNSGLALGFALGTAVGGWLIDVGGTSLSFGLAVAGAALSALIAWLSRATVVRVIRTPGDDPPAIALNDDPIIGPVT